MPSRRIEGVPFTPTELSKRAERFRSKAARLLETGKQAPEGTIRETYTALVIEYDFLARELERIVKEISADRSLERYAVRSR